MDSRTVLVVDAHPHDFGGGQRLNVLLAARMPERGWDVELVTTGPGPLVERARSAGATVAVLPVPRALSRYGHTTTGQHAARAALALPAFWARVARHVRRRRAGLVHVVDHRGMVLAGPPARLAGASLVWHLHTLEPHASIDRVGSRLAAEVVVPSQLAVERRMPYVADRGVTVVGNPLLDRAVPDRLDPLPRTTTVVTLARVHPEKGIDVLLRAWPSVVRANPEARLRIFGLVPDRAASLHTELQQLMRELDIEATASMLGPTDAPFDELASARVYVQPSRSESFGLAVVEAMAAGAPVVATDVPGLSGLVADRQTGLVVPAEDPSALARAIVELLGDRQLSDTLRANAFASLSVGFDEETFLDRIGQVWTRAP